MNYKRLIVNSIKCVNTIIVTMAILFGLVFLFWLCANAIIVIMGLKIKFFVAGTIGLIGFFVIIIVNLAISDKVEDWLEEVKKGEEEKDEEA